MSVRQVERKTQERVVELFQARGYECAGHWDQRVGTSYIDVDYLQQKIQSRVYDVRQYWPRLKQRREDSVLAP